MFRKKAFIILIIGLMISSGYLQAQERSLKAKLVIGSVQIIDERDPDAQWEKVRYNTEIKEGTKIRTGATARLEATDGENLYKIGPRSVVRIATLLESSVSRASAIQLIAGKIHAAIEPFLKNNDHYEMSTPYAVAAIRGTELALHTGGKSSSLYVFKGKVEFSDAAHQNEPVLVLENQMAELEEGMPPGKVSRIPDKIYQEWNKEIPAEEVIAQAEPENNEPPPPPPPSASDSDSSGKTKDSEPEDSSPETPADIPPPEPASKPIETQSTNTETLASVSATNTNTGLPETPTAPAQESTPRSERKSPWSKPSEPSFDMNAQLGPINLNATNFQQLTLMPEFTFWRFGIGLYFPFFINPEEELLSKTSLRNISDWDFKNWNDGMRDTLSKILHLRFGEKSDPIYFKLGNIDDFTIGEGFIMYRYSNMLGFPNVKKLGGQLNINTRYAGLESMCSDLFMFQIFGGRIYIKPLGFMDKGPLRKLNTGLTYLVDLQPGAIEYDPVIRHWAWDAVFPFAESKIFTSRFYVQYGGNSIKFKDGTVYPYEGRAFVGGVRGNVLFLPFKVEYRYLPNGYQPEYFDSFYDNNRQGKFNSTLPGFISPDAFDPFHGIVGESGLKFPDKGELIITYWENLNSTDTENFFHVGLIIEKDVIPKFSGQVSLDKYNIVKIKNFFMKPFLNENTSIIAQGVYSVDPAVDLAFTWKRTYIWNTSGALEPFTTYSIETRFNFF